MAWEFPAVEALGDAVVLVAVDGTGDRRGEQPLRIVYANRHAETVFALEPDGPRSVPESSVPESSVPESETTAVAQVGDRDRILAVATDGRPESWVSRSSGGRYEVRAARLSGVPGGPALVLVVARGLGAVDSLPSEPGSARVALLLEISRRLGSAVSEDQVAHVFFDLVCPALGAAPGELAVTGPDGAVTVIRRTARGTLLRTGGSPTDAVLVAAAREGVQRLEGAPPTGTVLTMPLHAGAVPVGAMRLPLSADGEPGGGQQEFIDTVAALVAQAVQRARLFDAQLEASLALQHALLPPTLPRVPGLELAARYRAGSGHEVGGDWYDVVPLPSGWVAFVIGDVQGHDLPAAALMGQIRSVVRAYLLDELPPTAVLGSANAFLLSLGVDRLVTVCVALVHPRSRVVTLATAGHACPLLVRPGQPGELMEIPPGPPLGVLDGVIWRERTALLPAMAALVLYTDGLIERRARPYEDGERLLLELAAILPDAAADQLADAVLAIAGVEQPRPLASSGAPPTADAGDLLNEDDTALLLARWDRAAGDGAADGYVRTLPVAPASAVIARWYVDDLLTSWGVDEEVRETAVLLTDEVVANAVRHAHRTIRLDVTARPESILVEVFDDSHREPRLDEVELHATSGRGLRLVEALASAWGVRMSQGDLGKTVWFSIDRQS